ncbi:zinc ribbon domain-containing protein [Kribbella sp. NPDC026611]|uniref:zinc ribbon domain-containing protein n=1 Tax=Kribbella sp. NPDC026611 TaxID=3154911 RepID=UPI0033E22605
MAAPRSTDAAKLVVPVQPSEVPEIEPQQVKERPAPIRRTAPTEKLRPGDLVCPECGTGNPPTRKFCSRCGESLAAAQTVKVRWWHRLRFRRGPRTMQAGSRPSRPGDSRVKHAATSTVRRLRAAVSVLLVTFAVLCGIYPPLRTYVVQQASNVKQKVRGVADSALTPVRPAAVQGTAGPGHPARAAFDTFSNTAWIAPWSEKATTRLTVRLDHAVALRKLIVRNGDAKNYAGHSRPAALELQYSNEKSESVTLADSPEPQEIALHDAVGVSQFTITVITVYPAQGAHDLAVSEIELFGIG